MRTGGGRDGPIRPGRCAASPDRGRTTGHPPRALLRPGLSLRPHPGNRLPHLSPHVAGDVAGRRAAHGAMGACAVYSWLTNDVPAEEANPARLVIFCSVAAMFVASLAVPYSFGEYGVLFGLAFFVLFLL